MGQYRRPDLASGLLLSDCLLKLATLSISSAALCVISLSTAIQQCRTHLVTMKKQGGDEAFKTAANTLLKYIGNVARSPDEDKYRNINTGNAAFQSRVAAVPGSIDFLKVIGFQVSHVHEHDTACALLIQHQLSCSGACAWL